MSQFDIKGLPLIGAKIVKKIKHEDERGYLSRLFCIDELSKEKVFKSIKQINLTLTKKKNTIRGLHYQYPPFAETKMISCIKGEVFDVIVDLRKNSPTFLKYHSEILSEKNQKSLIIPEGFAHGFQCLEDNCNLLYFHTESYKPDFEKGIRYDDKKLKIQWPLPTNIISNRDLKFPLILDNFSGIKI
tara:strand:- start:1354 stop:1914 length:561 start_codon:yes stop_codon:yes gene_type:complete